MTNDSHKRLFPQEEITQFAVFGSESVVTFIINAFTLIAFAKNRHLRKRSTYLIMNLTVADLMVGAVKIPLFIFESQILKRDLKRGEGFSWQAFTIMVFNFLFVLCSLVNISLISLERLHATVYPFRHCLIRECFYFKIIMCSWLIALLLSFLLAFFYFCVLAVFPWASASCIFLALLIVTISYVIIISHVKSNPHPQNFGPNLSAERKLTITLFIVTVISYLTILPWAICSAIPSDIWSTLSPTITSPSLQRTIISPYFANSIVNPLIYVIRMEEFRKAAKELVCKRTPELVRARPI